MRSRSFGSAKVTYFDKEAVWKALRKAAAGIAAHPEVRRVLVFGSLVRDEAVPGSDVDLLIVTDDIGMSFIDRPGRYRPPGFPVGVDIFAYTEAEMAEMLAADNHFLRRALSEGQTLFERPDGA